jgi:hypothetical protein
MSAVYKAIAEVQGELAKVGIAKNRRNQQGSGYNFRGIDDVYAALSPLLSKHGLVVIPRLIEREQVERTSQKGGALFYTTVKAEFDFVAVEDGSKHTACTYGEAMDSGDKSTNKAMSAAYKYAAFMAFAIPTEGDNDADGQTHDVAPVNVIDDAQRANLMTLASEAGADMRGFCTFYKISALPELPAVRYEHAFAMLNKKLLSKAAPQQEAA